MAPYRIVCRNDVCQHTFVATPDNLIILVFKRPGFERRFMFYDCPHCCCNDSRAIKQTEVVRWKAEGVLVFSYSYDNTSDEMISKLLYFPDELTNLHCDLAAVTVMDDHAFRHDLDEHIFTDGPTHNP